MTCRPWPCLLCDRCSCASSPVVLDFAIASGPVDAALCVHSLANNNIGPQGAKHLSEGLMKNTSITELDISNRYQSEASSGKIKAEGAKFIADMLASNHTIVKLK